MRDAPRRAVARPSTTRTHGAFSVRRKYEPPDWIEWDDHTLPRRRLRDVRAGGATSPSSRSIRDTFEVRPIKLTAVQEFGRPIHPALARGQIEGGTAQGSATRCSSTS